MKRIFVLFISVIACLCASAQPVVTQISCNYQKGRMAIVADKARVGWQYEVKGESGLAV